MESTAHQLPDNVTPLKRPGRPLTTNGHVDQAALAVVDIRYKLRVIVDNLRDVAGDVTDIDHELRIIRSMIAEARAATEADGMGGPVRIGVATGLGRVPTWKLEADRLFGSTGSKLRSTVATLSSGPSWKTCT